MDWEFQYANLLRKQRKILDQILFLDWLLYTGTLLNYSITAN